MTQAWRIVKKKHAESAFSGKGAAKYGGRWNSSGVEVVYASSSKALAALEILVHLNPRTFFSYVVFHLEFEESLIETFPQRRLPKNWRMEPPPASAQKIGTTWVREARSALLALPSVLTHETNYLLNPLHPDFKKISIKRPQPFTFDPRLLE